MTPMASPPAGFSESGCEELYLFLKQDKFKIEERQRHEDHQRRMENLEKAFYRSEIDLHDGLVRSFVNDIWVRLGIISTPVDCD